MEEFITILNDEIAEIVEKKSKFIANLIHVESIEEAESKIKEVKKKYKINFTMLLKMKCYMI